MQFLDIPNVNPYLRFFYTSGNVKCILFASHGIWTLKKYGMKKLEYTYNWYTQPGDLLTLTQFQQELQDMGITEPN